MEEDNIESKVFLSSSSSSSSSSSLVNKKPNRVPVRRGANKKNDSNKQTVNNSITLSDVPTNESHVEIDFDLKLAQPEQPLIESTAEKNLQDKALISKTNLEQFDYACKCQDESMLKSHQIHRHRHLRKRHHKLSSNNKSLDSNESIDDSDSKRIPSIQFDKEIKSYIPSQGFQYQMNKEKNREESREENKARSAFVNSGEKNFRSFIIQSSSLNRSKHVHQSAPNLKSISLEEIDIKSVDSISNTERTLIFCKKFSSNMELSTKGQQIYKHLSNDDLILNNKKAINKNLRYLKTESSEILINNNKNNKLTQRYKLIVEGDVNLCKLTHNTNVFTKILSSKLLRRWKTHRLILRNSGIFSTTKSDYIENGIPYHTIIDVSSISKWEPGQKYCFRVATLDCHYLIQTNNVYVRDRWIHSIIWKKHKFKSEKVLKLAVRPEVLIKEIKSMVEMSLATPIEDNEIYQHPLELVSEILQKQNLPKQMHEEIIVCLSPLLEKNHPSPEICDFFSKHCKNSPRSHIVIEMFTPVVQRILKHNGDFGRHPRMRLFIQDYLTALMSQNEGLETVQSFVVSMHSPTSQCPFPRVLPNFVSVCLAAIHSCFGQRKNFRSTTQPTQIMLSKQEKEDQLICHTKMMLTMSKFDDWILNLAQLLQSVPFPDQALTHEKFIKIFKKIVENFADDSRCEVHQALLGIREGKEGWFEIFCPGGISCDDEGELFSLMLKRLIGCCCKKKRFLLSINKLLSQIMVLAVREVPSAIETLCAMLDFDGVENPENKLQIISTLQSTHLGIKMYAKVCERLMQLRELQQKGGPRKLTLPSRSTDEDLAKLLLSGSFGNLECLSLAFTNVTSACAEYLIKLPSLRYLNLWSTKFGDEGLELISEHLQRLQVLNLCETPVTDKGLACLASMKQLRKLNLNSTNLSALTFEGLKECLPALQECDIRYTDAW